MAAQATAEMVAEIKKPGWTEWDDRRGRRWTRETSLQVVGLVVNIDCYWRALSNMVLPHAKVVHCNEGNSTLIGLYGLVQKDRISQGRWHERTQKQQTSPIHYNNIDLTNIIIVVSLNGESKTLWCCKIYDHHIVRHP